MNHSYTQAELENLKNEGRGILVNFRTAAEIKFSAGAGQFILSPLTRKVSGMPFTKRGRVHALTATQFQTALSY